MVRGLGVALAVAAVGSLIAPVAGRAAARPDVGAIGPMPELEKALGRRRGAIVALDRASGRMIGHAGGLERLREAAPPGSIAKVVVAYAALQARVTDAQRRITCPGRYAGRTCSSRHGPLRLDEALAASCNVHFLTLAAAVGHTTLEETARAFGFGRVTGLLAGEDAGHVGGSAADLAHGAGPAFEATPLQIAQALRAVSGATGGLDEHGLAPVRAGLRAAVRPGGTAAGFAGEGIWGKTGTAIFDPGSTPPRWYGHFAGYTADRVLVVRVEGRSAARAAVPVARRALAALPRSARRAPGARERRRLAGQGEVRVRLFAAHRIEMLRVAGPGATVEGGGKRRILGERHLRLTANLTGTVTVSPSPGTSVWLLPDATTRRGRPESATRRRIDGRLEIRSRGGELVAIAHLDPDTYAGDVALAELGPDWPPAAVTAQAILARTYAARHRDRHAEDDADVCDLTHCQLYQGAKRRDPQARAALAGARRLLLMADGEPIEALYHAACGGHLAANEDVFGGKPVAYLRGGPDSWCRTTPPGGPWRTHVSWPRISDAFAGDPDLAVGRVSALRVVRRSRAGYPVAMGLKGERGERVVPAYAVWRALGHELGWGRVKGVRFSLVPDAEGAAFVGRGLGHGVGFCQWGARQRALAGEMAACILAAYFPGTELERI